MVIVVSGSLRVLRLLQVNEVLAGSGSSGFRVSATTRRALSRLTCCGAVDCCARTPTVQDSIRVKMYFRMTDRMLKSPGRIGHRVVGIVKAAQQHLTSRFWKLPARRLHSGLP